MPRNGVRTTGEGHSPDLHRKGPKRASSDTDGLVAKWFDDAVKCYGKAMSLAEELGVGDAFLSEMRSGKRGIALRHLLPFLGNIEAVLAFVAPLLESINYVARPVNGMTRPQLAEALLADLEGEPMGRKLIEQAAEKHGQTREQISMALRREDEK